MNSSGGATSVAPAPSFASYAVMRGVGGTVAGEFNGHIGRPIDNQYRAADYAQPVGR
jgi:hypothetical protein